MTTPQELALATALAPVRAHYRALIAIAQEHDRLSPVRSAWRDDLHRQRRPEHGARRSIRQ